MLTFQVTDKQKRFIKAHLSGLNAKDSAIAAGYSAKSAHVEGSRLLKRPDILEALSLKTKESIVKSDLKTKVSIDRVIAEFSHLAFLDPAKFFDERGVQRPINELPEEVSRALTGIKQTRHGQELRFENKLEALNSLAKYLGIFQEQPAMQMGLNITINTSPPAQPSIEVVPTVVPNDDEDPNLP